MTVPSISKSSSSMAGTPSSSEKKAYGTNNIAASKAKGIGTLLLVEVC